MNGKPDMEERAKILAASDGYNRLNLWASKAFHDIPRVRDDMFTEQAPEKEGLWVWEGSVVGPDYDQIELVGSWRKATTAEVVEYHETGLLTED